MDIGRQLADLLYSSSPEQPAEPQQRRIAQFVDPERLRRLGGIGEAALTLGTGLVGSVPAGLAGMAQMIPTRGRTPDVNKAAQTVEDVQGALTYLPRGETGQRVLQRGLAPLEMLGAPAEYLGEKTLELTGSPGAATAANVLLDPVNFIGLPGSGKATMAATKAAGRAAAAAPRVAGEMIGDILTPAPRAQAQRGAIDLGPQMPEFQPQRSAGLVSRADEALAALPRSKGTGAEFLRELQKTPGVKPAELEDRGLIDALSGMGKVTKADVLKVLQDNPPVQFEEVVLGGAGKLPDNLQNYYENSSRAVPQTPEGWVEHSERMERVAQQFQRQGRIAQADRMFELAQEMGAMAERLDTESGRAFSASKFSKYTIPGGENYREILLTLPEKPKKETWEWFDPDTQESRRGFATRQAAYDDRPNIGAVVSKVEAEDSPQNYRSGHWEQPNVLAHARISDRTGPNGEKILHVEEVQSDWHQTGRKEGYKTGKEKEQISALSKQYDELTNRRRQLLKQAEEMPGGGPEFVSLIDESNAITPKLMRLQEQMDSLRLAGDRGVPDAPFKKNWHELMMKRLVNYAAENGYDRIAITPGAEQASRYDLSKQINALRVQKNMDGSFALRIKRTEQDRTFEPLKSRISQDELPDVIGKELAERIVQDSAEKKDFDQAYSGLDLQVGGEGMKGFYDKILPSYLKELGKPYGASVGEMRIPSPPKDSSVVMGYPLGEEYMQGRVTWSEFLSANPEAAQKFSIPVHSFDITPQMREAIKSKGLPLYKEGGSVHISDNPDTMALALQAGGAIKAAAKAAERAAKAAKPEVLSSAERDANLAKMLEASQVKSPLYHSSRSPDIDTFYSWTHLGTKKAAEDRARQIMQTNPEGVTTYPVHALIKNPLRTEDLGLNQMGFWNLEKLINNLDPRKVDFSKWSGGKKGLKADYATDQDPSIVEDFLRRNGYDSIVYRNQAEDPGSDSYIIFNPKNIKSATGNRGTFDVTRPEITKKRGGKVSITDNLDTMRLAVQKRK